MYWLFEKQWFIMFIFIKIGKLIIKLFLKWHVIITNSFVRKAEYWDAVIQHQSFQNSHFHMKIYKVCLELFFQIKSVFHVEKRTGLWLNQVGAFSELLQHKCSMTLPSSSYQVQRLLKAKKVIKLMFFMVSTRNSFENWHFLLNHKCVAVTSKYYCFYNVMTKGQGSWSCAENTVTKPLGGKKNRSKIKELKQSNIRNFSQMEAHLSNNESS